MKSILILQGMYDILALFIRIVYIYIEMILEMIPTFYIEIDVKTYNRLC